MIYLSGACVSIGVDVNSSINSNTYVDHTLAKSYRVLESIQQQTALLSVLEIISVNANIPIEKLSIWVGQGIPLHQAIQLLGEPMGSPLPKHIQTIINLSKSSQLDTQQLLQLAKQLDNNGQTMASLAVCALLNGEAGLINAPQNIREQAVQLKNAIVGAGSPRPRGVRLRRTPLQTIYRSVRDVGHAAQNPYTIASLMVAGMAYRVVKASIASAGLGESAWIAQAAKVSGVVVGTNVEAGVFTVSQMLPEIVGRGVRLRRTPDISWQQFWAAYQQNLVMVASLKAGGALFGKAAETAHGVSPVGAGLPRPQLLGAETAPLRADNFIHATRGLEFAKFNIAVAQQAGSFTGMLASNLYGNPNLSWAQNFTEAAHATVAYGLAGKMGVVAVGAGSPRPQLLGAETVPLRIGVKHGSLSKLEMTILGKTNSWFPTFLGPNFATATSVASKVSGELDIGGKLNPLENLFNGLSAMMGIPKEGSHITQKGYVLIFGATSDIAKSLAHEYAAKGYSLHLVARTPSENDAAELRSRYQVTVQTHTLEALDFNQHENFYHNLEPKPVGVIAAWGYLGDNDLANRDFKEAGKIIDINYTSFVSLLNIVANDFAVSTEKKFIIGISSVAGDRGRGSNYHYGASKAAFTAYLSGLRARLSDKGIQVLTIKPGFVDTKMIAHKKVPALLNSSPDKVAQDIFQAQQKGKEVVYTPWHWRWIMLITKWMPEWLFKKIKS